MLYAYLGHHHDPRDQARILTNLPDKVGLDVETVDLAGPPIGLAIAPNENEAFWFDYDEPLWRDLLKESTTIFHNAHYDMEKIGWYRAFEDTYLLYAGIGFEHLSLKTLAWDMAMLDFPTAKELMATYRAKNMLGVPREKVIEMCCLHARATKAIYDRLPLISPTYELLDKPMIPLLLKMEQAGLYIDQEEVKRQLAAIIPPKNEALYNFQAIYGAINLNSPKQLGAALGLPSTNKSFLADIEFAGKAYLQEYRHLSKFISTYLLPFQNKVDKNGRIHTKLDYTRTGRLRSGGSKEDEEATNLQNIPTGEIRKCVVAAEGKVFLDFDYSQLELRVLAHLSQDKVMIDAFDKGLDLHQLTADEVLRDSTKRRQAKTLNFALVYGAEENKIMELVGCDKQEALAVQQRIFRTYEGFASWVRQTKTFIRAHGYVETMFGRRRKLSEMDHPSAWVRAKGLREGVNTMVSSPAVDIVKLAMLELSDYNMVLQIHDELLFEEDARIADSLIGPIIEICQSAYPLRSHLTVEAKKGKTYYDVH